MADPISPEFRQPQGVSLDELTQAYAQAMSGHAGPPAGEPSGGEHADLDSPAPAENAACAASPTGHAAITETAEAHEVPVSPSSVLEALLFVGTIDNRSLEAAKASELMRGVLPQDIPQLVQELNARYASNGCPYKIVEEGTGYRMVLRRAFHPIRNKFYGNLREARLSQAAIDTLAIVAYRQPLTSEQVSQLRGTPSGHLLTQLVRRQLLEVQRAEGNRQVLYKTSGRFLELFGLESLKDLPDSE